MRSEMEINQQVKALQALKERLPAYSIFGEPYPGAVDAMIEVIISGVSESDIPTRYLKQELNAPDMIMNCAFSARDWLDGEYEGNLEDEFKDVLQRVH